jgi:hypothetical protein
MRTKLRGKVTLLFMMLGMLLAVPAVAIAADLNSDVNADLSSNVNAPTVVEPNGQKSFDIKVWATGNISGGSGSATGEANVATSYTMAATDGAITPDSGSNITLQFNVGHNYSTGCPASVAPQPPDVMGCGTSANPFVVPATLNVGNAANGTDGTLIVSMTGSPNLNLKPPATPGGTSPSLDTGYVEVQSSNTAPIANAGGSYTFDEGSDTNALSGSGTDTEDDAASPPVPLTYAWDLDNNGTFETPGQNTNFDATNIDGPTTRTVTLRVTDSGGLSDTDSATVTIDNVAPTVSSVSASVSNALANNDVTFTGTATDPSSADRAAKFFWQWSKDGTNYSPSLPSPFLVPNTYSNEYTTSFDSCGPKSVKAKATDKDLGTSLPFTSTSVSLYNGSFLPPIDTPAINLTLKGKVLPVKISVGCNGQALAGLTPSIKLLNGNVTPQNDTGNDDIEAYSTSSADTTGWMRPVDGGYIYNLQVPGNAIANQELTVRVNPFAKYDPDPSKAIVNPEGGGMYALLKIRK